MDLILSLTVQHTYSLKRDQDKVSFHKFDQLQYIPELQRLPIVPYTPIMLPWVYPIRLVQGLFAFATIGLTAYSWCPAIDT